MIEGQEGAMKSRKEISAGGVVYRRGVSGVEVVIAKAGGYHRWVLPKGLVRRDESYEETALRETEEETGVQARVVAPLGEPERYIYTARGVRVFKEVHYFLMEYVAGEAVPRDGEMEAVEWAPLAEALARLDYEGARAVLRRAAEALGEQASPPDPLAM